MCSYNAVNGVPTCASSYLLQTILREHWGWTNENQYVTSDCDAVQNIFNAHDYAPTREAAVADALNAGTDLDCGTYYPLHLPGAYSQGLFNESTLNTALIRQYSALVMLGWFDGPTAEYRNLDFSDVNTPASQQLALTAAEEGIVLLKNDGILPLSVTNDTVIALLGEWANATTQMQGNYYGTPPYLHSPLYAAQQLGLKVNYNQGVGGQGDPTTDDWQSVVADVQNSSVVIFASGIDNSVESEGMDRYTIGWTAAQKDLISYVASMKPTVLLQVCLV